MKNVLSVLLLTVLACTACAGSYVVKGDVSSCCEDGESVTINIISQEGSFVPLATAVVEDGVFSVKVKPETDDVAVLSLIIDGVQHNYSFFLEKGVVQLSFEDDNLIMGGTPANDGLCKLNREAYKLNDESADVLAKIQQAAEGNGDATQFEDDIQDLQNSFLNLIISAITENCDNLCGLYQLAENFNILTPEESHMLLGMLSDKFADNELFIQMKSLNDGKLLTSAGHDYIDITVLGVDDNNINLSDIVKSNKVVLLDFWASWCAPCVQEIPNMKNVYNKYHDKGLEILSVSLDQDETEWRNALQEYNMPWIQSIDNETGVNSAAYKYLIDAIPAIFLINSDGIIIASQLRGESIDKTLENFFE
ncbi:MAG: AhpC/TSA family protein [Bacteroidaceae bacterium]|nr:AhpC/TSA family protein [Bacteroidaceae bacterium]